jgi:putative ABC transport system permease protein
MAEKLFGEENALGKIITADDSIQLTVTGVLQAIPSNTTLRPEVLLTAALLNDNTSFREAADWYNTFAENYFLLKPGADTNKLNRQINQLAQTFYSPEIRQNRLQLTPYTEFVKNEAGEIVQVIIKGEISIIVFILLIVVANLINLNAATIFSRAREVAVKQMMGSSKLQIVVQFCIENAILIITSLALGFMIFHAVLLPQVNSIIGNRFGTIALNMHHDYPLALVILFVGFVIVIIAGSYSAFHLTSLKVTDAVKGKISGISKKQYARNIFITLQFILAITFIGVSVILSRQISHMKTASLGFNKEDVLVVPINLAFRNMESAHAQFDVLLNELRNNPYIKNISTSEDIPTAYQSNFNTFYDPASGKEISMRVAYTDAGLIPTYEIPLIEGRNFKNVPAENEQGNIIINRKAMQAFGWQSALGKKLKSKGSDETLTVTGIMEDFHYMDLTRNIEPLIHRYADRQQLGYTYMSLRIDAGHTNRITEQLQAGFQAIPSRRQFSYEYMNDRIDKQYALLNGILKVTNYVSLLTIIIAAMGLFGLVALFSKQRVKEIGIRKVLGANVTDIIGMLSQNYVVLVVTASLIALPLVWYIMDRWLQDFAYRITVSWWMLLISGTAVLVVALAIVLYQAIKTAVANPVKSLRTE